MSSFNPFRLNHLQSHKKDVGGYVSFVQDTIPEMEGISPAAMMYIKGNNSLYNEYMRVKDKEVEEQLAMKGFDTIGDNNHVFDTGGPMQISGQTKNQEDKVQLYTPYVIADKAPEGYYPIAENSEGTYSPLVEMPVLSVSAADARRRREEFERQYGTISQGEQENPIIGGIKDWYYDNPQNQKLVGTAGKFVAGPTVAGFTLPYLYAGAQTVLPQLMEWSWAPFSSSAKATVGSSLAASQIPAWSAYTDAALQGTITGNVLNDMQDVYEHAKETGDVPEGVYAGANTLLALSPLAAVNPAIKLKGVENAIRTAKGFARKGAKSFDRFLNPNKTISKISELERQDTEMRRNAFQQAENVFSNNSRAIDDIEVIDNPKIMTFEQYLNTYQKPQVSQEAFNNKIAFNNLHKNVNDLVVTNDNGTLVYNLDSYKKFLNQVEDQKLFDKIKNENQYYEGDFVYNNTFDNGISFKSPFITHYNDPITGKTIDTFYGIKQHNTNIKDRPFISEDFKSVDEILNPSPAEGIARKWERGDISAQVTNPTNKFSLQEIPVKNSNIATFQKHNEEIMKIANTGGDYGILGGSSVIFEQGLLPGTPHDDEFITTIDRVDSLTKNLKFVKDDTKYSKSYVLRGTSPYAQNNLVDIQIIQEGPNGEALGDTAHEIINTLWGNEKYYKYLKDNAIENAKQGREGTNVFLINPDTNQPYTAEEVYQIAKSPEFMFKKTMHDMISSDKTKQVQRSQYLYTSKNSTAKQLATEAIDELYAICGGKRATELFTNLNYDNTAQNAAFLRFLGLDDKVANDPEIMRNIIDRFYLEWSYISRGVRDGGGKEYGQGSVKTNEEIEEAILTNQSRGGVVSGGGGNNTTGQAGAHISYGSRNRGTGSIPGVDSIAYAGYNAMYQTPITHHPEQVKTIEDLLKLFYSDMERQLVDSSIVSKISNEARKKGFEQLADYIDDLNKSDVNLRNLTQAISDTSDKRLSNLDNFNSKEEYDMARQQFSDIAYDILDIPVYIGHGYGGGNTYHRTNNYMGLLQRDKINRNTLRYSPGKKIEKGHMPITLEELQGKAFDSPSDITKDYLSPLDELSAANKAEQQPDSMTPETRTILDLNIVRNELMEGNDSRIKEFNQNASPITIAKDTTKVEGQGASTTITVTPRINKLQFNNSDLNLYTLQLTDNNGDVYNVLLPNTGNLQKINEALKDTAIEQEIKDYNRLIANKLRALDASRTKGPHNMRLSELQQIHDKSTHLQDILNLAYQLSLIVGVPGTFVGGGFYLSNKAAKERAQVTQLEDENEKVKIGLPAIFRSLYGISSDQSFLLRDKIIREWDKSNNNNKSSIRNKQYPSLQEWMFNNTGIIETNLSSILSENAENDINRAESTILDSPPVELSYYPGVKERVLDAYLNDTDINTSNIKKEVGTEDINTDRDIAHLKNWLNFINKDKNARKFYKEEYNNYKEKKKKYLKGDYFK